MGIWRVSFHALALHGSGAGASRISGTPRGRDTPQPIKGTSHSSANHLRLSADGYVSPTASAGGGGPAGEYEGPDTVDDWGAVAVPDPSANSVVGAAWMDWARAEDAYRRLQRTFALRARCAESRLNLRTPDARGRWTFGCFHRQPERSSCPTGRVCSNPVGNKPLITKRR